MSKLRVKAKPGVEIVGTVETVPGCAGIHSPYIADDGTLSWEWEGETKMYWDGSETQERNRERLFEGDDGEEYQESELELVDDDGNAFDPQPQPEPAKATDTAPAATVICEHVTGPALGEPTITVPLSLAREVSRALGIASGFMSGFEDEDDPDMMNPDDYKAVCDTEERFDKLLPSELEVNAPEAPRG